MALRKRAISSEVGRQWSEKLDAEIDGNGVSVSVSIFNLVKNIVGAGILSLPYGVASGTGLIPAVIICAVLGAYAGYTFSLVGRNCEAVKRFTFHELGEATSGPKFATALDFACTFKTFFSCIAYSLVITDSFGAIFRSFGLPLVFTTHLRVLLGMTCCVLLPLCLLRDLSSLSFTSLLGSAGMAYVTGFMAWRYVDGTYAPGGKYYETLDPRLRPIPGAELNMWTVNITTLILVCALSTAYIAHYNAPRFYHQLQERSPKRFNHVVATSFGIAICLFLVAMCAGYLTFGSHSQGLILNNYSSTDPLATAARIAVGTAIVFTYPLAFTGLRDGISALTGVSIEGHNFNIVTMALLTLITAVACVIRNVGFVNNFGGALFGACIIYIFPAMIFIFRAGPLDSTLEKLFAKLTIVAGVVLAVLGSIIAVLKQFQPEYLDHLK